MRKAHTVLGRERNYSAPLSDVKHNTRATTTQDICVSEGSTAAPKEAAQFHRKNALSFRGGQISVSGTKNLGFTLKRYHKRREAPPLFCFFFFFDLITSPQQQQSFKAFKDSQTPYTDTHSTDQQGSDTNVLEIVCCYISYICRMSSYCYNQDICTVQPIIYFSLCPGHWTAGN